MPPRLLPILLALTALLAVPASAGAALTVGISENQPRMFSDPLFQQLGVKHVRVVMSYNVMTSGDDELARVTAYLDAARAAGITPLVTFEHARGDATICNKRANLRKPVCRLPSAALYERNLRLFLARFPDVRTISPWNEVNHFTQGTSRDPRAAARFTDIVKKNCARCTVVAMDILDQADSVKAKRPTFRRTASYIARMRRAMKTPRSVCGLHNYSDTNRFRDTGTRALIKAMGCRQIWLTETGGLYDFGSFWSRSTRKGCSTNEACQLKATKYMFTVARRNKRIKRLYVYTYFGNVTPRFDAGLVADGQARSAYAEVKKRIR